MLFLLAAEIAVAQPFTVVIDPGHGGKRVVGVNDGSQASHGASHNNASVTVEGKVFYEKDLALSYSTFLAHHLVARGMTVRMTRKEDRSVSAMMRAAIAVENQADVFLAIHFNAGGGEGARAYVVAEDHVRWEYLHFFNPYLERDAALGRELVLGLDEAFRAFGGRGSEKKVFVDTRFPAKSAAAGALGLGNLKDGIRTIGYARLDPHLYRAAVVLLEVEFMDEPQRARWLISRDAHEAAARALGQALAKWRDGGRDHFRVEAPRKAPGR